MYVGIMNCIFAAHIEYRNISIPKNCQPVQNPLILYYPHAYPPPILSHPVHALPLFCPTSCMPSPYSVPPHAYPPPILSHPMHTLLLSYPTPCMPSPYSIPPMHALPLFYPTHAHPPPILSQPIHTFPLFYSTVCMSSPVLYQPTHATPVLPQLMHALLTPCHMNLEGMFLL